MGKKLEVGDRVAVYMPRGRRIGVIKEISSDSGNVCVYAPYDPESATPELCSFFHPKQCRRLKPKRKAREWWVVHEPDGRCLGVTETFEEAVHKKLSYGSVSITHVREILRPKP